jgi:hypothetical protein
LWTLCTGFKLASDNGGWLLLNDSFTEHSAHEWAVVHAHSFNQVESLTASWMRPEELTRFQEGRADGTTSRHQLGTVNPLKIEDRCQHGRCQLCAYSSYMATYGVLSEYGVASAIHPPARRRRRCRP